MLQHQCVQHDLILVSFLNFILLEYNCFAKLYSFLLCDEVNQLRLSIYALPLGPPPPQPPPIPPSRSSQSTELSFLCFIAGAHSICSTHGSVYRAPGGEHGNPLPVFLPGESPGTEAPGELQSMGSQRVGHDWATKLSTAQSMYVRPNLPAPPSLPSCPLSTSVLYVSIPTLETCSSVTLF